MGTVPIYWGESAGLAELLSAETPQHWARERLEQAHRLVPVDYLDAATLASHSRLLLAQPRGLTPEENVALDAWVRGGGKLLLFADPRMTGDSRFGIGDRRRPQDVVLLSPILDHWGLRLEFDENQEVGPSVREIAGTPVPVNLPGRFALTGEGVRACRLGEDALLAECQLGAGRVVILADAALLDIAGPWTGAPEALDRLVALAFAEGGEFTGNETLGGKAAADNGENPSLPRQSGGAELADQRARSGR